MRHAQWNEVASRLAVLHKSNITIASRAMNSEKTMLELEKKSNDVSRVSMMIGKSSHVKRSMRSEF